MPAGGLVVPRRSKHPHDLGDEILAFDPLTAATVPPSSVHFATRKFASAWDATCGRCVMQITWRAAPRRRSLSPTARAVLPPIPASISSNARVASRASARARSGRA